MSAALNRPISSFYDLDYIAGNTLPNHAGAVDAFLKQFQAAAELDTLTGELPDVLLKGFSPQQYAEIVSHWRDAANPSSVLESIRRHQSGEPKDRVAPRAWFEPIQEWEGYVVFVEQERFQARLLDLTEGAKSEQEQAVFHVDDVSDDDRPLLKPGAIFRWSLGYERSVSGSRRKVSSIVFRRLPIWTEKEIAESRRQAEDLLRSINWE